ncbi:hypothetical protein CYJ10_11525 [Cupriavidus pauculus]|uniref:Uncharacterized protein n=1 Tax=Cupriavidus pauculus TaxID=82633 RepID=A0A2N5CDE0_9BURK|nr:hypothetical protein CYJ10_11525 [Cupriavidus pauculus]
MRNSQSSLRGLVEKWLSPSEASPVRVTRFGQLADHKGCFVYVESIPATRGLSMAFFRHGDGEWYVFPPSAR